MRTSTPLPSIATAPDYTKPYQPFGNLVEALYAHDDEVIVEGAAGTGKSRSLLEKLHIVACKYPTARLLLIRKTRESLTQSSMVTYETKVIPNDGRVTWRTTEQEYRYWNGSKIVVGGLDKSSKIMSTDYDIIYIPEVTELTEGEYEDLTTRARNGVVPYNQTISDCNPSFSNHWVKRRWEEGKARRVHSDHTDNPELFDHSKGQWTPKGASYIRKLSNLSGVRRKRLFEGLWVTAEGLVYDHYDPLIHIIDRREINKAYRKICVIDFGFTNPFVCQWWMQNEDGDLIMYREIYMTRRTVRAHGELIRELSREEEIETFVCDHDAEDRATLEEMGFPTTPANKAISYGVQKVIERLGNKEAGKAPSLYLMRDSLVEIDESLRSDYKPYRTQDEFEEYIWAGTSKDVPIQVNNHGVDCTRYLTVYAEEGSRNGGIWA